MIKEDDKKRKFEGIRKKIRRGDNGPKDWSQKSFSKFKIRYNLEYVLKQEA
jgi:hypothetical protein